MKSQFRWVGRRVVGFRVTLVQAPLLALETVAQRGIIELKGLIPSFCLAPSQMIVREAGGFVLESRITTNAPKGDTFFVLIQWVGVAEGSNRTRVRISFKVEFIKSVGFLKGAIEGGAVGSTKKLMKVWVSLLKCGLFKGLQ